jgi:hypothetical protein
MEQHSALAARAEMLQVASCYCVAIYQMLKGSPALSSPAAELQCF